MVDGAGDGGVQERNELTGFLDWFRLVASNKVRGLSREDAVRVATPSGMTSLGVIKHLTWVERLWFRTFWLGEEREEVDNESSFRIEGADTTESVLAAYDQACERSRQIVLEVGSLEDRAITPHHFFGHVTMRWVLIHLIEETARHAGHLDILRELTDGQTGD